MPQTLAVTTDFQREYLEYYRLLPLDLGPEVLRVAVASGNHGRTGSPR